MVGNVVISSTPAQAAVGINKTLNYQGRLLNASGAVVADGTYNMQFKLYQDGPGNVAGDTGGTLMWTESWVYGVNTPDNRITVKNGYFSLPLGSICAFTATTCTANTGNAQTNTVVDFNQDTLWLSINIGNTTTAATFAGASGDGEMLPMRRLASSVYALQAGSCTTCMLQAPTSTAQNTITPTINGVTALTVNGTSGTAATAVNIVQAGAASNLTTNNTGATSQSLLSVTHSTSAYTGTAILVNVASGSGSFASGAFLDLQANGASKFKVDNLGAVTLAGGQAADITTLAGTAPTALVFQPGNNTTATSTGAALTLQAGNDSGATAATGGLLTLKGGNATGGSQTGGGVTIDSGTGTAGGAINIGTANAAVINIGKTASNIATTINGTAVVKPTTGNDSATAFQVKNAAGSANLTVNTINSGLTINQGGLTVAGISNPAAPTLALTATGGTLANATTYTYRLSATGPAGETMAIATNPASTTTANTTSLNTISWTAVTNATGYKLYRSINGGTTWFVNTLGLVTSAVDNGSNFTWATSGTPSLYSNATGNVSLVSGATLYLDSANDGQISSTEASTILGNYYGAGGAVSVQADSFHVQDTTGYNNNLIIDNTGASLFKNRVNSTTALRVQNAAAGNVLDVDTTNSRVGIATTAPSEALTVNGNFNVRDVDAATKQYRFRTSGSNLDVEGGGASLYLSVWSAANFTGVQHNKLVLENGADNSQAIRTWQFRDSPFGTLRHTVDGTVGANTAFNQDSEATNFIVQGQTDANLVFVQGSTNRVGIGNNAPGYKLDVTGTANASTSVLTPLLDTASAVALNVGTTNATAINLGKPATTNIATTITGTTVIKPTSGNDSATALQIQNGAAAPILTVDTINERVYVGPTAGDTVGAILVLGNKTTAGDPIGVNGATYYNASSATFRCYENGAWTDCLTHHVVVTTADQTSGAGSCTNQDVTGLTFAVSANRLYKFHAALEYDASATTVGIKLAGSFTGTLTRMSYVSYGLTGATSAWFGGGSGIDQGSCGSGSANTTGNTAVTEGSIQTATSGTFRLRFASSSGSGITIKAGSTIEWW